MTTSVATVKPLWLLIENKILELESQNLSGENRERTIQRMAGELDNEGLRISSHGGNMLQLRWALDKMMEVGRPLMKDFNAAVDFNVVMTGRGEFVEVQGTAEGKPFARDNIDSLLSLAEKGIKQLFEAQQEAVEKLKGG